MIVSVFLHAIVKNATWWHFITFFSRKDLEVCCVRKKDTANHSVYPMQSIKEKAPYDFLCAGHSEGLLPLRYLSQGNRQLRRFTAANVNSGPLLHGRSGAANLFPPETKERESENDSTSGNCPMRKALNRFARNWGAGGGGIWRGLYQVELRACSVFNEKRCGRGGQRWVGGTAICGTRVAGYNCPLSLINWYQLAMKHRFLHLVDSPARCAIRGCFFFSCY